MSHAYPLGKTVADALKPEAAAARTLPEAEALAGGLKVAELAIDFLTMSEDAAEGMFTAATGAAHGHLQRYEDEHGNPVVAVTWWKLVAPAPASKSKPAKPKPAKAEAEVADHTDDLYFRRGRTKPSRRRYVDPRQLDLFRKGPES